MHFTQPHADVVKRANVAYYGGIRDIPSQQLLHHQLFDN
jgi:hypothetical protein